MAGRAAYGELLCGAVTAHLNGFATTHTKGRLRGVVRASEYLKWHGSPCNSLRSTLRSGLSEGNRCHSSVEDSARTATRRGRFRVYESRQLPTLRAFSWHFHPPKGPNLLPQDSSILCAGGICAEESNSYPPHIREAARNRNTPTYSIPHGSSASFQPGIALASSQSNPQCKRYPG